MVSDYAMHNSLSAVTVNVSYNLAYLEDLERELTTFFTICSKVTAMIDDIGLSKKQRSPLQKVGHITKKHSKLYTIEMGTS